MAKFASMSMEPVLKLDKMMPLRKLILRNNLGFKNSSYNASKKQTIDSAWIIRETNLLDDIYGRGKITAIMRSNGAGKSSESFIFTRNCTCSHFISSLIPMLAIQSVISSNHVLAIVGTASIAAAVMKLYQNPKNWKWLINVLKGTKKCVKDEEMNKPHKITTSAAPNHKWRLWGEDLLFTLDAYTFQNFVYSMCVLIVWWVLSRLIPLGHRVFKNVRKLRFNWCM